MSKWQSVFSPTALKSGFAFWNEDKVSLIPLDADTYAGKVQDANTYYVTVKHAPKGRLIMTCDCPYSENSNCKHQAALLFQIQDADPDFLETEEKAEEPEKKPDSEPKRQLASDEMITDLQGVTLIEASRRSLRHNADTSKLEMPVLNQYHSNDTTPVDMVPIVNFIDGNEIKLEFSIGRDHYYVVRNVQTLYNDYTSKAVSEFGKNLTVDFGSACFTNRAQLCLQLITLSAKAGCFRNYGNYGNYVRYLPLEEANLDEFYNLFCGVEPGVLNLSGNPVSFGERKPAFDTQVLPVTKGKRLVALSVQFKAPFVLAGKYGLYFSDFRSNSFSKVADGDSGPLKEILEKRTRQYVEKCRIGLDQLKDFDYATLPALRWYGNVDLSKCPDVSAYSVPKPEFSFNLDYVGQVVECKAEVQYGDKVVRIRDKYQFFGSSENPTGLELDVVAQLERLFDCQDDGLWYLREPDSIYLFITKGLDILKQLGTVNVTSAFDSLKIRKAPKAGTTVSLEGNLLELSISTQDMDMYQLLDLLDSYKKKKVYHRLRDGSFIDLSGDLTDSKDEALGLMQLQTLITDLDVSKNALKGGKIMVPAYRAMYIEGLLKKREISDVQRTDAFEALLERFDTLRKKQYEVPKRIHAELREYQKAGFFWMSTLAACGFGGILADDMGLGKTLQALTYIQSLKEQASGAPAGSGAPGTSGVPGTFKSALVVCPASLVFNWAAEAARFAPDLKTVTVSGKQQEREAIIAGLGTPEGSYDLVITSYDLLRRDILLYEGHRFTVQIIDEAQFIKNHNTDAARAVKLISSDVRFALTGTPIENRLSELWSIFDFLMPSFLFSQSTFRAEFEVPIMKEHDRSVMERLRLMTSPFILRRLKTDVLKDLPEKLQEDRVAKFGDLQQQLYDAQVAKIKTSIGSKSKKDFNESKIAILAEITRLRQICCDPSLVFEDYDGESAKRVLCLDLVKSAMEGGHRVLLFSQFTSMLSLLEKDLKQNGIEYYKIIGSTDKQERLKLVDDFNSGSVPVFLISLKAGGTGLNLTGADVVIHYDPWWNTAVQNQATDRAHRIGQTRVVNVFRLIAKDSIEEKIVQLQQKKSELADGILSGDNISLSSLSADELLEILS